jgi:hypothetical protein
MRKYVVLASTCAILVLLLTTFMTRHPERSAGVTVRDSGSVSTQSPIISTNKDVSSPTDKDVSAPAQTVTTKAVNQLPGVEQVKIVPHKDSVVLKNSATHKRPATLEEKLFKTDEGDREAREKSEYESESLGIAGRAVMGQTGQTSTPQKTSTLSRAAVAGRQVPVNRAPRESKLVRAHSFTGDLRQLPQTRPTLKERPEREGPGEDEARAGDDAPIGAGLPVDGPAAPAPTPATSFNGLDFANWGAGRPPDTNGDVGPTYYIQTVNTSIGIYRKSDNVRVAAFTFDTFMSQGNFGNLCDTDNFGDPVVLYDSFEDRWIITDFAFTIDGSGNVTSNSYQCFAASKTGDPVSGGWNFYSLVSTDKLGDYPKFGIWPDGVYMAANMFGFPASGTFSNSRVWALNKAQMYAGTPSVQIVLFDAPATSDGGSNFTFLPSNARLQAGTPPSGTPNYYSMVNSFTNAVSIWKFHVDWNNISTSTFTGPFYSFAPASWASAPSTVPAQGGNNNDTLATRLMMQNQYTSIGGVESLWDSHTVRGSSASQSAVRYYQIDITSGTVAANVTQAATWNPDTTNRYIPSLAVDRAGDMAIGYSASSSTLFPAIRYAGRLSTDPVNTFGFTETSLIEGTGSQNTSTRWGDYSAMTLDPDGCTFWYTTEYYATTGNNWQTRIGSFSFPQCTPVGGGGSIQGTVTVNGSGTPISGATVTLGTRTTTTAANGTYSFSNIPAGTYPSITASAPGYNSVTVNSVVVVDGSTTTQNFALTAAATSACLTDTTQADFQMGTPTSVDLTASPGDVVLADNLDQQNTSLSNSGATINTTTWAGQTFTAGTTSTLSKIDVNLFCSGCTGTTPAITVEVRTASGNLPTSTVLATTTIPGFSSAVSTIYTATFSTPATLTAGTQYAFTLRVVTAPSVGNYAATFSSGSPYAAGRRVSSTNSGGTWTGATTDLGFKTYMKATSGNLVSSTKDANPAIGSLPFWGTLTWTATVPANTTLKFQVAASNNPAGPFNFVGPDGTASTFFTSGASLAQFNGLRYLKYKAFFTTTSPPATATLADVTICFNVAPLSISGQVTDGTNPISGVLMTLSGTTSGTTTTDGSGNYSFSGLTLNGNYTVTPSKLSYTFTPASRTFNPLTTPQTGANFVGRLGHKFSDFDGDGKADVATWNPGTGNWKIQQSSTSTLQTFPWGSGALGDILTPGDYDGDGKTDYAVWRPSDGNFYIIKSSDGSGFAKGWGANGDVPVPGDYDGDGKTDVAIYRPSEGNWYIVKSTGGVQQQGWGANGDKLVPGDYDGDGKTDIAVYRPSEGNWYIVKSTGGVTVQGWGANGDKPVPGDYDGDGKTDVAIFRPSEGNWYIVKSSGGTTIRGWGASTDQLAPADYDGDGKTDIAIYRPSEGNWYIILSSTNAAITVNFGTGGDLPIPTAYIQTLP